MEKTLAKTYQLSSDLKEFDIWDLDFKGIFEDLPTHIREICYYGFTEMVNNAIDHSAGNTLTITVNHYNGAVCIIIEDDGIGIFNKIASAFNLPSPQLVFLELAKGKLTTDPAHHSGQGIFFTSHLFDSFHIFNQNLTYISKTNQNTQYSSKIINHNIERPLGTLITMVIAINQTRTLKAIFDKFAPPDDDFLFNNTLVPVRFAQYTEDKLISRSQGKRLVSRLEEFDKVTFDFTDVEFIGPAFADEVFRVFPHRYPQITLDYINAKPDVARMIKSVLKK